MSKFDIGSPVWKWAAKLGRERYHLCHDSVIRLDDFLIQTQVELKEAEATAAGLRELLREIEKFVQVCPICLIRIVDHPFEIYKKASGHAKDCELAKELADA